MPFKDSKQASRIAKEAWAKRTTEQKSAHGRMMAHKKSIKYGWKWNKENMSQVQKDVKDL